MFVFPVLIAAAKPDVVNTEINWFAETVKGGLTSLALVLLLLFGVALAVERFLSLRRKYFIDDRLVPAVRILWFTGDFEGILSRCREFPCTFSDMVEYLVVNRKASPDLLIPGAQDIAARELNEQSRKNTLLAVVAALAPLLGLLGTMIGMIEAFKLVEVYGDEGGASMLAGSISKALITTAVGLIIAIPAVSLYNYFKYRIGQLSGQLELELEKLVNLWLLRAEPDPDMYENSAAEPTAPAASEAE